MNEAKEAGLEALDDVKEAGLEALNEAKAGLITVLKEAIKKFGDLIKEKVQALLASKHPCFRTGNGIDFLRMQAQDARRGQGCNRL